jgi:hypothetical protein
MQNAEHVIKAPNKAQIQYYTRIYKAPRTNEVKGQDPESYITVFWTLKGGGWRKQSNSCKNALSRLRNRSIAY